MWWFTPVTLTRKYHLMSSISSGYPNHHPFDWGFPFWNIHWGYSSSIYGISSTAQEFVCFKELTTRRQSRLTVPSSASSFLFQLLWGFSNGVPLYRWMVLVNGKIPPRNGGWLGVPLWRNGNLHVANNDNLTLGDGLLVCVPHQTSL